MGLVVAGSRSRPWLRASWPKPSNNWLHPGAAARRQPVTPPNTRLPTVVEGRRRRIGLTPPGSRSPTYSDVRRLACTAGIVPAVLDGESLPLDLGRARRFFTEAQHTALATRYTECATTDCDRPYAWCELHHEHPWSTGGHTTIDKAVPLCGFHHHRVHDPTRTIAAMADGAPTMLTTTPSPPQPRQHRGCSPPVTDRNHPAGYFGVPPNRAPPS